MTEAELAEIEARVATATPGPWPELVVDITMGGDLLLAGPGHGLPGAIYATPADLRFCAAARSDVPTLIAEVRRLRAALLLVEFGSCDGCGYKHHCIECGAMRGCVRNEEPYEVYNEPHKADCPIGKALGREPSDQ